jgi:hypothetical protein
LYPNQEDEDWSSLFTEFKREAGVLAPDETKEFTFTIDHPTVLLVKVYLVGRDPALFSLQVAPAAREEPILSVHPVMLTPSLLLIKKVVPISKESLAISREWHILLSSDSSDAARVGLLLAVAKSAAEFEEMGRGTRDVP